MRFPGIDLAFQDEKMCWLDHVDNPTRIADIAAQLSIQILAASSSCTRAQTSRTIKLKGAQSTLEHFGLFMSNAPGGLLVNVAIARALWR